MKFIKYSIDLYICIKIIHIKYIYTRSCYIKVRIDKIMKKFFSFYNYMKIKYSKFCLFSHHKKYFFPIDFIFFHFCFKMLEMFYFFSLFFFFVNHKATI